MSRMTPANTRTHAVSLIFDLEISDAGKSHVNSTSTSIDASKLDTRTIVHELNRYIKPVTSTELQLIDDVSKFQAAAEETSEASFSSNLSDLSSDLSDLSSHLKQLGYIVTTVRVSGGGDGVACFHNLRHKYLSVFVPRDTDRYIVDPLFKDQFVIANPTNRYSSLLACLPWTLVLPEDHVQHLVAFICKEMNAAFKETAVEIPPWRKLASMLTKWPGKETYQKQSYERKSWSQPSLRPMQAVKPNIRQYGGFSLLSQALGHLA